MMKVLLIIIFSGFICLQSKAQTVEVKSDVEKINSNRYPGHSVKITSDVFKLEDAVKKKLRELGKMRERNTYFVVTDVVLDGFEYGERSFYAELKKSDVIQTFWLGVDTVGMVTADWESLSKTLEVYLYDFSINFYKSLVQEEVDESIQAENYMVKKQARLVKNKADLEDELLKNEEDLIQLQKAIEENKLRHEVLLKKIENNSYEQDSTAISLEKIRQVIKIKEARRDSIK